MNTKIIVIANGIALLASCLMVAIGFLRNKNQILAVQCGQFSLYTLANALLGGWTGALTNLMSLVRNILCIKWKFTLPMKIFFIVAQIIPAFFINDKGLIGWLPIIAAVLFTWFMDTKDDLTLKYVIMVGQALWLFYDFVIYNYVSMIFDAVTIIANTYAIVKMKQVKQ